MISVPKNRQPTEQTMSMTLPMNTYHRRTIATGGEKEDPSAIRMKFLLWNPPTSRNVALRSRTLAPLTSTINTSMS